MVRVGLYLYGLEPNTVSNTLQPALSVRARINHTNAIEQGQRVGYGHTWQAERPSRLAAISIGYADGVDRGLSNQIKGLLMGQVINQVGRISMDQMLFDITDVPEAEEGDVITLIGSEGQNSLYLSEWAVCLDTITYELACRLRVRLPRIYTRNKK
jgi:alanine racemase